MLIGLILAGISLCFGQGQLTRPESKPKPKPQATTPAHKPQPKKQTTNTNKKERQAKEPVYTPSSSPPPPVEVVRFSGREYINGLPVDWNNVTQQQKDVITEMIEGLMEVGAGSFTMRGVRDSYHKFRTAHEVRVESFYLDRYEVTQKLWKAVFPGKKCQALLKGDNNPMENISWKDIDAFLKELKRLTGLSFRLPTDSEWLYAAMGGNRSRNYRYSGGDSLGNVAWFYSNSNETTHPVGLKQPNELGIYDMTGNVWEMTSDYVELIENFDSNLEREGYVCRGGSWFDYADDIDFWVFDVNEPTRTNIDLGFRLALSK